MFEDFFIERLISLRNQKNVSAREMSLAIGQNESYINRIENICEYFQISPMDFFNDGCSYPAKTNKIIEDLNKLNETQLDIIITVINGLLERNHS